jgi:outer membrane autotransporter protein
LTFSLSGGIRRLGAVLLGAWIVFCIGAATPALADCIQSGTTITCSGPSPTGFTAAPGEDGLTVTVQPGATVSNPGNVPISVNSNNVVTNFGSIATDVVGGAAISGAGTGNQITNAGTVAGSGANVNGIGTLGGTVMNSGTITLTGDFAIGMFAPTATNTGTISVGDGGVGIFGGANGGSLTNSGSIVALGAGSGIGLNNNVSSVSILNSGSISVGDDGIGINGNLNNNNLTIVNSGTITFGGCGTGILATGTGNSILNSGTLAVAICGAGGGGLGIQSGDSSTITNTGNITVGEFGGGISGGGDSTIVNSGRIVTGDGGAGIVVFGDNTTVSNSGTIITGEGVGFSGGIVAQGNNLRLSNSGTISGGSTTFGIFLAGGTDGTLTNSGTITVGDSSLAMAAGDARATLINSGRIVVGQEGTGLFAGGNDSVLTNTGTIIVGASSSFPSGGMVADGNRMRLTNSGTIIVGDGTVAMVTTGNDGVLTNSGSITTGIFGGGLATQGNRTRLTNTGTIVTGDDGIGISSLGNDAVVTNSGTIQVGACGLGIDTSSGSGSTITNSGRITGTGCGATGVNMGDGDTLTNSGTISAPISIASFGTATVTNSGTLDGTIQLGGPSSSLTNAGLITVTAPLVAGGSVAHSIDGTFTQTRTGTLALRVMPDSSAGNYDTLQVTGVANLGGTLKPIVQPELYGPTTTYVGALTFASSTGRFDSVAPASLFLAASAVYNIDSVDLVLTRLPFNSVIGGGTANARAIGNVLEANYSTSLTGTLATFYSNLLQSSSPNTLAQLTGEVATAPQNASFGVFGQFLGTVFGQTATSRAAGQAAAGGQSTTALARSNTTGGGTHTAFAFAEECFSDYCDSSARRVTAWAQGFGGIGSIDANATTGASRVNLNSAGGALGVDMQVTPNLLAGVTMGTTNAGFGLSDIASSGSSRSIVLGVYGGYTQGPLYVDAAFAYAYNTFNTTRSINTGSMAEVAYGAFDGHQYGGRVEGGWRFAIDQNVLTPFAGLTVQALSQSTYTETSRDITTGNPGILGVTVQGQTTTSVRSILGLQFETEIVAADSAVVKPRVRLGWAHEFNTNRSASVALNVLPSAPFQVNGAQPNADSLVVGAGLELELGRVLRVYGQFDGDFSGNARGVSGTGGIRLVW